jgi:importin subunit alpha-2
MPLIPVFAELLASDDVQLLEDSIWGLSYLCDGPNERIQAMLKHGVLSRVVPLLSHPLQKIKAAALRLVGNIASGNDCQTQEILHYGALDPILLLLNSQRASTRKEVVWLLSNVAAGTPAQKQLLFEKRVYPRLLVLYGQSSFTIRKEIIWTVSNALSDGTAAQAAHLIKIGFIKPLLAECEGADVELVKIALQAISQLLRVQEAATMAILTENDAATTFEALQQHRDHDVYDAAIKLIEDYFDGIEDIEDVEDIIDLTADSMMF